MKMMIAVLLAAGLMASGYVQAADAPQSTPDSNNSKPLPTPGTVTASGASAGNLSTGAVVGIAVGAAVIIAVAASGGGGSNHSTGTTGTH